MSGQRQRPAAGGQPSRSTLVSASALRAVGEAGSIASVTIERCEAWIALDVEIDRLTLRWATLEAQVARDHGWLLLGAEARRALPEAAEMFQIDDELEVLSNRRDAALGPLSQLSAENLRDIASKLAVAARLLQREDMRAQPLVDAALRELAQLQCSGCGAPEAL